MMLFRLHRAQPKQHHLTQGNNMNNKKWARHSPHGYEVSSRGDRRFSAFYARLKNGLTVEQAWQRAKGSAKGKPAVHANFDYWKVYLGLWRLWAHQNPSMISELRRLSAGRVLTDRFASTQNNQARALAIILGE